MKRVSLLLTLAAIAAFAAAALAGEYGACTASTQECLNKMTSHLQATGWLGVDGEFDRESGEFTVTAVTPHSPAAEAGLAKGDLLFGLDGKKFADMSEEDWAASAKDRRPGKKAVYMVEHDGYKKKVSVVLAEMPADLVAKKVGAHMLEHAEVAAVQ